MNDIAVVYLDLNLLTPNPWNPNQMPADLLRKEEESIRQFGFIDPIHVRAHENRYQIIDGEHRWKAAHNVGLTRIPCIVLDITDDAVAQQLTIVLNDLRGKPDEERLAALVRDLAARRSMLDLERVLPYKRERLAEMIAERKANFDWDQLRPRVEEKPDPEKQWVERVYRLPMAAALVIDEAIAKVKDEDIKDDWRALELICADYLSGD